MDLAYDALRARWEHGGLTRHRRPFLIKDRTLDAALVVQFQGGTARVDCDGGSFAVRAGDAFCLRPGVRHTIELTAESVLSRWSHLRCTLFGSLDAFRLVEPRRSFAGAEADAIGDLNQALVENATAALDDVRRAVRGHALAYDLIERVLAGGRGVAGAPALAARVARLAPVLDHIDRNLHRVLGRDELAALIGVSPPRFYAVFSQALGISLREHLQRRRLDRARQLLVGTREPVEDIARAVGITNPCHFSRWFRGRTRLTPTDYRRRVGDQGI